MKKKTRRDEHAFRRFIRRVWRDDLAPLLRDRHAARRKTAARTGGRLAAAGGLLLDKALRLRGRPFTRAMTVVGASLGAMLPDVWDWRWLRRVATRADRKLVGERVRKSAAALDEDEALGLFGLNSAASRESLRAAHRAASKRWHPDLAADAESRAEHHVRFLAYQAAYERLERAHDEGRLPREERA